MAYASSPLSSSSLGLTFNNRFMEDSPTNAQSLTFGEKAVGIAFNPGQNQDVFALKNECAKVIDRLNELRTKADSPEVKRLCSVAITEMQTAQMWAVKAVTWSD
jgi:hypothetical protein